MLLSLSYKTKRFRVVMGLYNNSSQKTSNCCKNINDTLSFTWCNLFVNYTIHSENSWMYCCYYTISYLDKVTHYYLSANIWKAFFNPLHPEISMHILHSVLHKFPKVLIRRICLTIKSFLSWWLLWCNTGVI